jgi:hypothetical protein
MPVIPPGYQPPNTEGLDKMKELKRDPAKFRAFMQQYLKKSPAAGHGTGK